MGDAPAVQASFDGRGAWAAVQATLTAASAACAILWIASGFGWSAGWVALAGFAAAAVAAIWAKRSVPTPSGRLRWDGAAWSVELDGRDALPGTPVPTIDLGRWMLVRFTPSPSAVPNPPRAVWLPLARSAAPGDWGLLRAALFAHARRGNGAATG